MNGAYVDDGALNVVLDHVDHCIVGKVCSSVEVKIDLGIPVIHGHLLKSAERHLERSARIVDKYVDGAELCKEVFHHLLAYVVLAYVAAENDGLNAVALALCGDLVCAVGIGVVGNAYVVAFLRECYRGGGSDSVGGTGNKYVLAHDFSFCVDENIESYFELRCAVTV